jgi:hypothetical protein
VEEEVAMAKWESSWEFEMPAEAPEDLLVALVVRDLLHGSSYDVALEEQGGEMAVDFVAGDELEEQTFRLLIGAEVEGPEDHELLQELTEQVLEELIEEAETLVEERVELGEMAAERVVFRAVKEDEERWDLVIPEWLAPDGAEAPFGYRGYLADSGEPWPGNSELEAHGRVVMVPHGGVVKLYGIPAPTGECECEEEQGGQPDPQP